MPASLGRDAVAEPAAGGGAKGFARRGHPHQVLGLRHAQPLELPADQGVFLMAPDVLEALLSAPKLNGR